MTRGNENISSKLAKNLLYVNERCVNSYWMLRNVKFKLIFKSIYIEMQHRMEDVRAWLYKEKQLDDSKVPGSRFVNKCKLVPPSHRPTTSQISSPATFRADSKVLAKELQNILASFPFQDNWKS